MVVALSQGLAEGAPGMETSSEGMLLVALTDKAQAARMLVLFGSHVLDVHLVSRTCVSLRPFRLLGSAFQITRVILGPPLYPTHLAGLQTQLDLHLACLGPYPHVDLWGWQGRWSHEGLKNSPVFWPQNSRLQMSGLLEQVGVSPLGRCLTT